MAEWIKSIRRKIGNELIFVNSAGGWIEDNNGRVLLQNRSSTEAKWGFPGGIMELGESASEAAIREIKEETGLDVEPVELIGVYSKYFATLANGHQCQTFTTFFLMRIVGGSLSCDFDETFSLEFFPVTAMPTLWCHQHSEIALDVIAGRRGVFR